MSKAEPTTDVLQRLKAMDAVLEESAVQPQAPRMSEPVVVVRPVEVFRPVLHETAPPSSWFTGAGFFAVGLVWGLAALWMTRRRYQAGTLARAQQKAAIETKLTEAKTHIGLLEQTLAEFSSEAKESSKQIEQLRAALSMAKKHAEHLEGQCGSIGVRVAETFENVESQHRENTALLQTVGELRQTVGMLEASLEESRRQENNLQAEAASLKTALTAQSQQWLAQAAALEAQLAEAVKTSQQDNPGGNAEVDKEASAAVLQELEALRQANARFSSQHSEHEWYLGEERAKGLRFAEEAQQLQGEMEHMRAQLAESRKHSDEANWYLGEEKDANARLSLELERLRAQSAPPATDAWNGQERRQFPRTAYDEASAVQAELCDPVTGKRFGRGHAINLGKLGLGVKLAFLPLLGRFKDGRVRCRILPSHSDSQPIESEGRIAWWRRGSGSSGEAGIVFDNPVTSSVQASHC